MDSNNLIGSIDQELDYLQEIVGRGFATIKSYCLNDGKLDPVLMD